MSPINVNIDIKALKGVTQDSREVKQGYLFAALKGENTDGRRFINDAINNGASFILADKDTQETSGAQFILVDNPRKEFSSIVAGFYGKQPNHIVAVTGTNGKSSVVHFIDQLWQSIGEDGAFIGTLSGSMTTPDPVSLHKQLAQMMCNNLAIEASSHGLEQYRMDGLKVSIAAFTNLTQDHLDYHGSMEDYFSAKLRLFSEILERDGAAVLNADIPQYQTLLDRCGGRHVLSYGENGKDIKLISLLVAGSSQKIEIEVMGKFYKVNLPLVGNFQAMNALCALACVIAQYPDKIDGLIPALEKLEGAAGRLQQVANNIYIDYAHTPDALENVLEALRPHTKGKLICVFGCGGDRDKAKRPLMGAIAARLADITVITDDNPRSENPATIRAEILGGVNNTNSNIHEIAGRSEAIKFAISQMDIDDILLVAGKGHEQGQVFNGFTEPFDDAIEVKTMLSKGK